MDGLLVHLLRWRWGFEFN